MDYNYLNNSVLASQLENEISVFEGNSSFPKVNSFTIVKSCSGQFMIVGEDTVFKGSYENLGISLITQEIGTSVFYLKSNLSKNIKEIYRKENEIKSISEIIPLSSISYRVNFFNLVNEQQEYFEMVSDNDTRICNIFYGDSKEGAPVICKINRVNNEYCKVQLTSGIDYIFILGLASFFFCKDIYTGDEYNKKYDDLARVNMPATPGSPDDDKNNSSNSNKNNKQNKINKKVVKKAVDDSDECCDVCCDDKNNNFLGRKNNISNNTKDLFQKNNKLNMFLEQCDEEDEDNFNMNGNNDLNFLPSPKFCDGESDKFFFSNKKFKWNISL